jgi:hypothetical protein
MTPKTRAPGIIFFLLTAIAFILACAVSVGPATSSPPAFDSTKAALELQNTAVALQLTQSSLNVPTQPIGLPASTDAPHSVPTSEAPPTLQVTQAPQVPPDIQKLVDDYYEKGYLPSAEGEYHHLEDFTMESSDRQVVFAKRDTGYAVKDFMVKAHFKWKSAIANPDPGGCGWAFRGTKDSTYFTFVDHDWIYLGMFKGSQWNRYGKTSGNAWVGFGSLAEADVTLTVSKGKAYVIINDAFASSYTLSMDNLTGAGELDYAVVAGTFKDYGTRCEMTNVDLWISNP